jgi:tRNA threonylcarbamoyladenosine biosynthesis protein TsaB
MSLILHIDTALPNASVCLSKDENIIAASHNEDLQSQASWLHVGINDMIKSSGFNISSLDAVSVCIGPGSYTGLRTGLSSAKGLCYALSVPLITVTTTEKLAFAVIEESVDLICPVIDARRMEVFTATYDKNLNEVKAPYALIVNEKSFDELLNGHYVLFCGNGTEKLISLIKHPNAAFSAGIADAKDMAPIAVGKFQKRDFAELAYTEPLYVKEFYSPPRKD